MAKAYIMRLGPPFEITILPVPAPIPPMVEAHSLGVGFIVGGCCAGSARPGAATSPGAATTPGALSHIHLLRLDVGPRHRTVCSGKRNKDRLLWIAVI